MNYFSEYIKSILSVGICAFLCESVCQSFSKSRAMQSGIKFVTGLCVFLLAVSPLISLLNHDYSSSFDFSQKAQGQVTEQTLISLTEKDLENSIYEAILSQTGIQTEKIRVETEYQNNNLEIKSITITAKTEGEKEQLQQFITNNLGKELNTEITVRENGEN